MRIALVIERFDPRAGGAERSTAQIAAELVARGHEVAVLTSHADPAHAPPGVSVVAWDHARTRSGAGIWLFSRWARQTLVEKAFDASLSVTMSAPAAIVQPRSGTVREDHIRNVARRDGAIARWSKRIALRLSPKQRALLALERRTLSDPLVKRIVAISRYVARQLDSHYRIDPARVVLIPNAAEVDRLDDDAKARARAMVRQGFQIADDEPAFLFPAHDPWRKGFVPLLRAMKAIKDAGRPGVLLAAGAMEYRMQDLAERMGVRDRVRFLGPTRHMSTLYPAADATVLPTFYDPASKVVIESLMLGTPAISTAFNGASDMILPEGRPPRGRVVDDPWNIDALARAMLELSDPAENQKCRAATAGLIDELSMKNHVDQLERVFHEVARKM